MQNSTERSGRRKAKSLIIMSAEFGRHSNLQCFLDSTTPSLVSHSLSKRSTGRAEAEYFNLEELWDLFNEWSAYGVGVPILFPGGEVVVQHYVPYLSALQIYTTKAKSPAAALRAAMEDSESDDCEIEKHYRSWDAVSDDSSIESDASSSPLMNLDGCPYLQYFEDRPPWGRIPLMNKITELSQSYPGLMTFKSIDVSPASWMSIAWYPIYHIPAHKNSKDLSASFLTFHSISSSFQDNLFMEAVEKETFSVPVDKIGSRSKETISKLISLPPFGLATYKLEGSLWMNPETFDHEKISSLYRSAFSWLKQLRVYHHDFNFFISRAI